ncbi:classical arabinogalactan protein 9-like [Myripristis murdjan]|uniref:classical arabinogalactan protein 9-like n=1 Tax=Myripristis murdjan TaxID=586833 RepID=UPI00117636A3|nr:classical arabinogalactan protein 9-like [Myripristis murdjan]
MSHLSPASFVPATTVPPPAPGLSTQPAGASPGDAQELAVAPTAAPATSLAPTPADRAQGVHVPPFLQTAVPPAIYPAPIVHPPPSLRNPPPFSSGPGLIPPPEVHQPQPVYACGPTGFYPPWDPPGTQPPLGSMPTSHCQPPLSKETYYRQQHYHQDESNGYQHPGSTRFQVWLSWCILEPQP